jgi:cytochrome c peroxidase
MMSSRTTIIIRRTKQLIIIFVKRCPISSSFGIISKSPILFLLIALLFVKCHFSDSSFPIGFMPIPEDDQMYEDKVELGRKLFFDKRLSKTNKISCATCHLPEFAFTDRLPISEGVEGRKTMRNAPTLLNVAYQPTLMFDAHIPTLEQQVIAPIQEHMEMDMKMGDLIQKLRSISSYQEQAKKVFGRAFDAFVLTRSISAFERTLISQNSRFDKYMKGDKNAINIVEIEGYRIFSKKLYCSKCHAFPSFTNFKAENNGLYSDYIEDKGRFRIYNDSSDIGKFKVPTLRNIELTFPYMHDGSLHSLEDVLNHYASGGNKPKNQHYSIQPFVLNNKEKQQLIAFLKSLTDTSYLEDFKKY